MPMLPTHILFLSDMTTADGRSIDPDLLSINAHPRSSKYSFPPDHPTREDWLTWIDIWHQALGRHLILP